MTNNQAQTLSTALASAGLIFGIIGLALTIFFIYVYWRIFSKAGFSGALSLLLLIPVANIIVICYLSFAEWPIMRELNALRQQAAMRPPQYPQGPQYPQASQYPQGPQGPQYPQYPNR